MGRRSYYAREYLIGRVVGSVYSSELGRFYEQLMVSF
jgi:hypothetical protein